MLEVATEGCCKGHKCDNCKTCQRGRCCRRDNPHYQLPKLGEWGGPIYGELGVLIDDGEKCECHICGGWFLSVGKHARTAHDVLAREYKALFGLRSRRGILADAQRARLRAVLAQGNGKARQLMAERGVYPTPEMLSAQFAGVKRSPQTKREILIMLKKHLTCKRGHAWTGDNTRYRRRENGTLSKACRKCDVIRARARKAREIDGALKEQA
jgi:hypothetical protein